MVLSSSHVGTWELDHKGDWVPQNWCFQIVVLEKTLESLVVDKDTRSVIPQKINGKYSLERLRLNWKLRYFGHLMQRADSLEKTLMLGKIESRRRWGWQRRRWLGDIIDSMNISVCRFWEIVKDREDWDLHSMGSQRVGHDLATEQQQTIPEGIPCGSAIKVLLPVQENRVDT